MLNLGVWIPRLCFWDRALLPPHTSHITYTGSTAMGGGASVAAGDGPAAGSALARRNERLGNKKAQLLARVPGGLQQTAALQKGQRCREMLQNHRRPMMPEPVDQKQRAETHYTRRRQVLSLIVEGEETEDCLEDIGPHPLL